MRYRPEQALVHDLQRCVLGHFNAEETCVRDRHKVVGIWRSVRSMQNVNLETMDKVLGFRR